MTEADLKAMTLHEVKKLQDDKKWFVFALRVPNGWIYTIESACGTTSTMVYETLPIIQHIEPRE